MSTNTQETSADILRNRTPVRGRNTQMLPVEFKNAHVVRFAEACRTPDNDLQHGQEFDRRSADGLKNLRRGCLLFLRFVQFTAKPCDLSFLAGRRRTTMAHSVRGFRLRFSRFAACSG